MARADLYIDPNRAGHSFYHEAELFRYVATHRENEVAFYCNIIATKGIAVYPNDRKGNVQTPHPSTYPNSRNKCNARRKQRYLSFKHAFGRDKGLLASHASYIAEHAELIPIGMTTDHMDGVSVHNHPSNIRLLSNADNNRYGGYMRKLRNKGIDVAMYPGIILEGYARMAEWKAEHTEWKYKCLTRDELLRIFVGPQFEVVSPVDIMELDLNSHREY